MSPSASSPSSSYWWRWLSPSCWRSRTASPTPRASTDVTLDLFLCRLRRLCTVGGRPMSMEILREARRIVRENPMDLKVGHLKSCAEALDKAYNAIIWQLTRETATEFVAHLTRTVTALDAITDKAPLKNTTI